MRWETDEALAQQRHQLVQQDALLLAEEQRCGCESGSHFLRRLDELAGERGWITGAIAALDRELEQRAVQRRADHDAGWTGFPGVRRLDPARTFEALVSWLKSMIEHRGCPGLAIGISGTDSILVFLACARAMELVGKAHRVLGVHYGKAWPPSGKTVEQVERMIQLSPDSHWIQRVVMPWLAEQAPRAQLVVDPTIAPGADHARWAALMARALEGADPHQPLETGATYWVVGTQNATEQALMTYSNISTAVSVQPLKGLWKSEVLALCRWLGVPETAIRHSRQADCDCGRFDTAAAHIEEVDAILMCRRDDMPRSWLTAHMAPDLLSTLEAFIDEQVRYAAFKRVIPYVPEEGAILRFRQDAAP